MTFRKATQADASRCLAIYDAVCDWEEANGKQTCWEKGWYPSEETVRDALAADDLYVMEDDVDGKTLIVACGRINFYQPEYYTRFDWKIAAGPEDALILHTFGVHPELQRRGYGQSFISFYRNKAVQLGCHVLRLDTLITNQKSQAMYTKLGFSRAGQTEADVDNNGTLYTLVGFEKAV